MEKLKLTAEDAGKALITLKEIIDTPYSVIVRDAAIQRFEYSFEIFWKFLREYLRVIEDYHKLMDRVYQHLMKEV
ncbi:nucleotidyltransferase family protein [Candidatus Methanoperedens nitroreducens]|uniref:Nucleotidyltransferase family protein n=1 Tax=Candidatus Methanoperedens nitratireducens TaxID=1392998 RepID=A0A062V310_9EURY|nr:nucleotidyltransferase substrate binding protein [Candidatus Methanoperedens nitroreducens]KCZ71757.1 nucleotidyltransferase family protein [Candidatus Methanoperedens nitroreducens]MDJ1422271.1 nucleotidyltransferase substrate binding protein [Candidatus Methanoperedens sp.]